MAKKISLLLMVVMLAGVYFTTDASAAAQWFTCTVEMAGPSGGKILIRLTDSSSAFTNKWFTAPAESGKEMLAVALTAMNSGMRVRVSADLSLSGYPPLGGFYLTP